MPAMPGLDANAYHPVVVINDFRLPFTTVKQQKSVAPMDRADGAVCAEICNSKGVFE
jgi:hypothetical protein